MVSEEHNLFCMEQAAPLAASLDSSQYSYSSSWRLLVLWRSQTGEPCDKTGDKQYGERDKKIWVSLWILWNAPVQNMTATVSLGTEHERSVSPNRICSNDAHDDCTCSVNSNSDVIQCICKRVRPINEMLWPQHLEEFGGMCVKWNLQLT